MFQNVLCAIETVIGYLREGRGGGEKTEMIISDNDEYFECHKSVWMVWMRDETYFNWIVIKGILKRWYLNWNLNNWNDASELDLEKSWRVEPSRQREEQKEFVFSGGHFEENTGREHMYKKYFPNQNLVYIIYS